MKTIDTIQIDMTKKYTLIKGDMIEVLPLFEPNTFDALITDPPYASGGKTTQERMKNTGKKYTSFKDGSPFPNFEGDQKDQRSWMLWMYHWLEDARKIVKPGGVFAIFIDWRQYPAMSDALQWSGWSWRGVCIWDKKNSRPQKGRYRQQAEFILWGSNGNLDINREVPVLPGVYAYSNTTGKKRLHQTQKPLELMRDVIKFCEPGGLILDPFAGSGSTLHAGALDGYRVFGIEKTKAYYNIAKERLEENIPRNEFGVELKTTE